MAKNVTFSLRIKVDGKDQIVAVSMDAKKFAKELENARTKSGKLRDDLVKYSQIGASFQSAINGVQQLTGVLREYTSANAVQGVSYAAKHRRRATIGRACNFKRQDLALNNI